jgi:cytochrome c oxidase subunit 2
MDFMDLMRKVLGLPVVASEHGHDVDRLIIYVHVLMIALFVGWFAYFLIAVVRFRSSRHPKANYSGVKSHASNYIEVAVAVVEGALLFGLAVPLWAKAIDKTPKDSESTVVQIVAQQFAWNIRYPGKDGVFGKQQMALVQDANLFGVDPADPAGKDDVQTLNEMHVPLVKNPDGQYKPVVVHISSKDVIHSFKVIALRVTQDAIPGMRVPLWFRPTEEGRYQINCAQLCGNGHTSMSQGFLVIESPEAFAKWQASKVGAATSFE